MWSSYTYCSLDKKTHYKQHTVELGGCTEKLFNRCCYSGLLLQIDTLEQETPPDRFLVSTQALRNTSLTINALSN